MQIRFATDRTWSGSIKDPKWFGDTWNPAPGHLTYGKCVVTIPAEHVPGIVEKHSIFRFEIAENPQRDVVVFRPASQSHDLFFADLSDEVRSRNEKEIVVFIHGFNNTFDDAASRLAVLAYDMDFNGVPILYSWCSTGGGFSGIEGYGHDEDVIQLTAGSLTRFLDEVASVGRQAGAKRINIVAHSMGNHALIWALTELAKRGQGKPLFDEAVMAAPDVFQTGFATDVWPGLQGPARRLTLYASSDDQAIKASMKVHRDLRIGQAGANLLLVTGLDTVDATGCDFTLLGFNHAYFGGPQVLSDMHLLLDDGLSPSARELTARTLRDLYYWVFPTLDPHSRGHASR